MKIIFWIVVLFGVSYSLWYAYYLIKDKNKLGAFGMLLVGLLIGGLSFVIRLQ